MQTWHSGRCPGFLVIEEFLEVYVMGHHHDKEIQELHHEPWKGFPVAFWILFLGGLAYLVYIFIDGFGGGHH